MNKEIQRLSGRRNKMNMCEVQFEQMNVVIVGHVDHGKSTLIGRLLADTGSLPKGKLEEIKDRCLRNARPFEYAFLLDALKDEQSQGITIDTARSFFKSQKRDYIIIDAPGHIEFLKNMITGAARAEAALLVIDAAEGIRENSRRHGYMLSLLGIKNITVCVNKMDLVAYRQEIFDEIKTQYSKFLEEINLEANNFIPISAREGQNIISLSKQMSWYHGNSILQQLDSFRKSAPKDEQPFRMPVQDIYKFTAQGDDRRIVVGRVESGTISVGQEVIFFPSQKRSKIKSIESFNTTAKKETFAGQSTGVCLETQIYISPGELMCRAQEGNLPHINSKIRTNLFWLGKQPFVKEKIYKLKIATQQVPVVLSEIVNVMNAAELSKSAKAHIDRHEVAECVLETLKPVAFDNVNMIPETGRFVVVDNYEIAGGGIILSPVFDNQSSLKQHINKREFEWERSAITPENRAFKYQHKSALIVITGQIDTGKQRIAKALEEKLFNMGKFTYFLGISNRLSLSSSELKDKTLVKFEHIQQLGELSHILTDAGLILITSITDIDDSDLDTLRFLNNPNKTLVVNVGENRFSSEKIDLNLVENEESQLAVNKIVDLLVKSVVLDPEYFI